MERKKIIATIAGIGIPASIIAYLLTRKPKPKPEEVGGQVQIEVTPVYTKLGKMLRYPAVYDESYRAISSFTITVKATVTAGIPPPDMEVSLTRTVVDLAGLEITGSFKSFVSQTAKSVPINTTKTFTFTDYASDIEPYLSKFGFRKVQYDARLKLTNPLGTFTKGATGYSPKVILGTPPSGTITIGVA